VIAGLAALGAAAVVAAAGPTGPIADATAPPGLGDGEAEECGRCHTRLYDAWRASRHGAAYTNAIFASSFAREPRRWCLYCHSPLAAQVAEAARLRVVDASQAPRAAEGVGCAACHLRDGVVLSAREPSARAIAAHPTRRDPRLGTEELCARCHQFNFPDARARGHVRYTAAPMQDTVGEWRRSGARATCRECHLRDGAHGFPGGHDAALLRDTLAVEVTRAAPDRAVVVVRARGAAHRVPTGDPFRRLWVELCDAPDCEEPLARPAFGRRYARTRAAWRRVADTTLPPAADESEARREVRIAGAPAGALHWRLVMGYVAPSTERDLEVGDRELEIVRGVVR